MKSTAFFIPRAGLIDVRQIDEEHEQVIEALEVVRLHIDENAYENVRLTREVASLLAAHFKSEERLMEAAGYPYLSQHVVHHDQSLGQIYRILGNAERVQSIDIGDLRDMYRVLIDDIFSADVAFSNFLRSRGIL